MKKLSPWPLAIACFLLVVIAVNAGFLYISIKTDDGLEDPHYYEKGLFYNARLESEKAAGWDIGYSFGPAPAIDSPGDIRVSVSKGGEAVKGAEVSVLIRRPTSGRFDHTLMLSPSGDAYSGKISVPREGYWDLDIKARKGDTVMERRFRIKV